MANFKARNFVAFRRFFLLFYRICDINFGSTLEDKFFFTKQIRSIENRQILTLYWQTTFGLKWYNRFMRK